MAISFPSQQTMTSNFNIGFPAVDNGTTIPCAITTEALQDHFQAGTDPMAAFLANRPTIESKAEQLILANRFGPNGSILIVSSDF